jgi:Ca2+:H+ antiporter
VLDGYQDQTNLTNWTVVVPALAVLALILTWGRGLATAVVIVAASLAGAVVAVVGLAKGVSPAIESAVAGASLTVPAIAIAMIWLPGPLLPGLAGTQMVLLTLVVGTLTVVPGRANVPQGGVHLGLLAVFLFLAASP